MIPQHLLFVSGLAPVVLAILCCRSKANFAHDIALFGVREESDSISSLFIIHAIRVKLESTYILDDKPGARAAASFGKV